MNNQNIYQEKEIERVELAKLRTRVSAYIVDIALFWFSWAIIFTIFMISLSQGGEYTIANARDLMEQFAYKTNLIITFLLFIYGGLLIGKYGWTLGKRYTNIAVVTAGTFKKVNFLRAFLREGIKFGFILMPYLGFFVLLINIYLIKSTSKRQTIHDMIAGTQVIIIPSDEKKKKILNFVVGFLAILFFIALGILFFQVSAVPKERTNLDTYRNGKYLYEIKYPSNWYVIDSFGDERVIYIQNVSQEEAENKIKNLQTKDLELIAVVVEEYSVDEWKSEWSKYKGEVKIEDVTVGIEKGYKIITEQSAIIGLPKKGNVYTLYQMFPPECELLKCKTFNQMLSAFKFIEVNETADWKTYRNDDYGFEIKYPEDWKVAKNIFRLEPNLVFCPLSLADDPDPELICRLKTSATKPQYEEGMIYLFASDSDPKHDDSKYHYLGSVSGKYYYLYSESNESIVNQMLSTFRFLE